MEHGAWSMEYGVECGRRGERENGRVGEWTSGRRRDGGIKGLSERV